MAKAHRAYLPEQYLLLPPNLRDWLPEGHLAHFVSDVLDQLDLSAIESVYEKEERGQASVPSTDDDQDSALRLLRRGIFLAPDAEEVAGGCRLPDAGGSE